MMESPIEKETQVDPNQLRNGKRAAVGEIARIDQRHDADGFSELTKLESHLKSYKAAITSTSKIVWAVRLDFHDFVHVAHRSFFHTGKRSGLAVESARLQAIEGLIWRQSQSQVAHAEDISAGAMYTEERRPLASFPYRDQAGPVGWTRAESARELLNRGSLEDFGEGLPARWKSSADLDHEPNRA